MNVYRIKLKGTDLFFTPVSTQSYTKTNLSKTGKLYKSKPSLKHISRKVYISEKLAREYSGRLNIIEVDNWGSRK